jgi:calcium-dependent protein kinase
MIDFGTSMEFREGETLQKPMGTCYYVAPEVLKKSYTEKCDVWSSGVLMYFLLCGHPPFLGKTEKEVLQKVFKGLFEFKDTEWKHITPDAVDLIRKLLDTNPAKRISAEEALNHPWFHQAANNKDTVNKNAMSKALENLRGFRAERKLQEAIWTFMVTYYASKDETQHLMQTFQALDIDKNGVLSKQEIVVGYKNIFGKAQNDREIEEMIDKLDSNNSGVIDYSEFITATINKQTLLSKAKLEGTFKLFDQDGDGYLTLTEFKELLNPEQFKFKKHMNSKGEIIDHTEDQIWKDIMGEIDKNQDGKVCLKEFKDLMVELMAKT